MTDQNSVFFAFGPNSYLNCDRAYPASTVKLKSLRAYQRLAKLLDEQEDERIGFELTTVKRYRGPSVPRGSIIDDFWVSNDADEFYFVSKDSQDYFWCLPAPPERLPGKVLRWNKVWWIRNEPWQLVGKDDLRTRFRAPKGIVVTPDEKWIILLHEGGLSTIDPSQPAEGEGAKRPTWLPALPHPDRRFHLNKAVFGKALYAIGDNFVASFTLDESTGELRFVQDEKLDSPVALTLGPDGRHLYVLGENSLTTFECLEGGHFKRLAEKEAESPTDIGVSPDGKNLYIAHPEAIAVWKRDQKTGLATYEGTASVRRPDMLQETDLVRVSPDGETLIAASTKTGTIVLFARDKHGGLKSQSISTAELAAEKKLVGVQYDASGKRVYIVRPSGAARPSCDMSVLEIR